MILGKLRKEAALYATIAIAGVAAGLVRTFFAIQFLRTFGSAWRCWPAPMGMCRQTSGRTICNFFWRQFGWLFQHDFTHRGNG